MKSPNVLSDMPNKGFRESKLRQSLVDLLLKTSQPLSVPEILEQFKKNQISVNKTTIYRQLNLLIENQLVRQVDLRERGRKFEYNLKSHHHHLICIKCKGIEDFTLDQDLENTEKKIQHQRGFKVLNHSLEFFGICQNCQN